MKPGMLIAGVLLGAAAVGGARGDDERVLIDPGEDAVLRRTDPGNDGPVNPCATLPDIVRIKVYGWLPTNPVSDPYEGEKVGHKDAHIFRLDVVLRGLVNPPGTVGKDNFDPFAFGPSPIFGFVELDVDHNRNTGGELYGAGTNRPLANVARFGALPAGGARCRAARSGLSQDYDIDFYSTPQFERSGEDFALVLCGCHAVDIVNQGGNGNGVFEEGETWILRSRFFQRAVGYREASGMAGGSFLQLYDPWVNLRFSHSCETDETTITLVYALDMEGAGLLIGDAPQLPDYLIDVGRNPSSVEEGLQDVIWGAEGYNTPGPIQGPVWDLAHCWAGEHARDSLDVTRWGISALVGTSYTTNVESLYAWTDVAIDMLPVGDLNGDGLVNRADAQIFDLTVQELNGGPHDDDHDAVRCEVRIVNFGPNFNLLDFDNNGIIDHRDRAFIIEKCVAEWNNDCFVNSQDLFDFISDFFQGHADANSDGYTNSQDFFDFLSVFFRGCP